MARLPTGPRAGRSGSFQGGEELETGEGMGVRAPLRIGAGVPGFGADVLGAAGEADDDV